MSNGTWDDNEEAGLADYLAERVCGRAAGRFDAFCARNAPRDVYFVGNLRPREEDGLDEDAPAYLSELINKLAPVAFGGDFRIEATPNAAAKVEVQWNVYYRVFPTYDEQRAHQQKPEDDELAQSAAFSTEMPGETTNAQETGDDGEVARAQEEQSERVAERESPEVAQSSRDRRAGRRPPTERDSMAIIWRKVPCRAHAIITVRPDVDGRLEADVRALQEALDDEVARAQSVVGADGRRVRVKSNPERAVSVPLDALASPARYADFLAGLHEEIALDWRWNVGAEVSLELAALARNDAAPAEGPNGCHNANNDGVAACVASLVFTNASLMAPQAANSEAYFFDTRATFAWRDTRVLPFTVDLAPRNFRYDRRLWGRGFNCALQRPNATDPDFFETTHTPIHRQARYATVTNPPARFEDLATDPIPVLTAIFGAMRDYRSQWDEQRDIYVASQGNWEARCGAAYDRDRQTFEDEIARFQRGCQLIRTDDDVREAFRLTNETFKNAGDDARLDKRKTDWRLFQLVFLVGQIPGMVALRDGDAEGLREREIVDIVYFPTGGGKTEAYLGVTVFHCFWDRLRGKTAGVTAWTRFPLRLLTLQQTQRVADAIGHAELLRQNSGDPRLSGEKVAPFAVGYLVGKEATPNEITPPIPNSRYGDQSDPDFLKAQDEATLQNWKRVVRCPCCRTDSLRVEYEAASVRVLHRCQNEGCAFPGGIVPLYVVDNEIYRYLPSVVVGTIDKLAGLGNQAKMALLLGRVRGRCRHHGFYNGKCCQKNCTDKKLLDQRVPSGLSGPTLFVQDELHLLKEGLGTFDSHYETFTQELLRQMSGETIEGVPLKVIASSATIEAFERQVEHLYGRRDAARVFPGPGPTLQSSFYAQTRDFPQRLFVGVLPHNKTIFNAVLELLEIYHREVQALQNLAASASNPWGGTLTPATPQWNELLDFYVTSLSYFLVGRELSSIHTDIRGDVSPHLENDGLKPLQVLEMTGGTSTDEVTRHLERLETSAQGSPVCDAVLATSMVSHGVDVNRLNAMFFYGMPRQNAEYIQASSRVGRAGVGLVFNCLHPARERDQSHYAYFAKFHEFLGQLVEPVAINRWAKFGIERTLPGLFMGVLLQLEATNSDSPGRFTRLDFVKGKISDGTLRPERFTELLCDAYGVTAGGAAVGALPTEGADEFRAQIERSVRQYFDFIQAAGAEKEWTSEAIIPAPMRSLRDVDEAIEIELIGAGAGWQGGRRASR